MPYLLFLKKLQNLKLSSGANYRYRFMACADPGTFVRGGPGQSEKKFFLVLSLFYRSQMVNFKEICRFSRFQRGSNIFQGGGSNFF